MIKELVFDVAEKFNYFPAKNGISKYYSTQMIMKQLGLDYDKDCKYEFGQYVQAYHKPKPSKKNTQVE